MTVTLRPYQLDGIAAIREAFRNGVRRVLYQLPTGGGKTEIFKHIAEQAATRGKRVCILVHRKELVSQVHERLTMPHGVIMQGVTPWPSLGLQVASVQTLVRRQHRYDPFDLLIVDEAHHAVASTYRTILTANPRAFVLGVTATPCRTDGKGLGECFDHLICGPGMQELIDAGYLKPARVYAPAVIDTSSVHTRMGDFVRGELAAVCDTNTVTGDAIAHYRRHAHGLPAIAFCVSVAHAVHVAEQFKAAGYRSEFIEGSMHDRDRKRLISALGTGGLDVLTSCDLISEGVDVPVVSCGIMLRPTQSLTIYLQQLGRCLRPSPRYPEAIILDHAGNCLRHGLHTDDRTWSLSGSLKRPRDGEALPPMRQCPACYRVHRPAPTCPDCGHVYVTVGRAVTERDGELAEITARREARAEQAKAQTLQELEEIARARGYKPGWARHVFAARQRKQAEPAMAG
jgi:superfamily II DNA or RNA helicase